MSDHIAAATEIRRLVDLLFEGQLDNQGMNRMYSLLKEYPQCQRIYVEQLDFHCELLDQVGETPDEEFIMDLMQELPELFNPEQSRRSWAAPIILACCLLFIGLGTTWVIYDQLHQKVPVGVIANLSADADVGSKRIELGQVLHLHETISIAAGNATFQLPAVLLDVIGPTSFRVESERKVKLIEGTLVVEVQPAAVGFTVSTPAADIVDLGTEFLVEHTAKNGTSVNVRRGAVQAKALDQKRNPTQILELTALRGARLPSLSNRFQEAAYSASVFERRDQTRGQIRRLSGQLRTISSPPLSLESNEQITLNHLLLIPEREVRLQEDITINGQNGPVRLKAGTTVRSYLVHYDPTDIVQLAPRGSVTFDRPINAVICSHDELERTDHLFGTPGMKFERQSFREIEPEEDEIHISDDRMTISFYFGLSPPAFLDEVRILVAADSN